VTLAQHVVSSTGKSAHSQLLTPPSAFPAVMPLSEVMPAVRVSAEMQAAHVPTPVSGSLPPPVVVQRASASTTAPVYPSKRSGRFVAILLGVTALGAGGYFGVTMMGRSKATPAAAEPAATEPPTRMKAERTVESPPVANTEQPSAQPPPNQEPAAPPQTPQVEPAPVVEDPEAELPPPVVKTSPPPRRTPPPKRTPPKVPSETTPTDPPKPPKPPKEQPKDPNWTSDSPFLPPKQ
jgi:hypothetical protein